MKRKKAIFFVLMFFSAFLVLEIVSRGILFFLKQGSPVLFHEPHITENVENEAGDVIHPYLGYVRKYGKKIYETYGSELLELPISRFGLVGTEEPIQQRSPNRVVIGILGGSFAKYFYLFGTGTLIETLKKAPQYKDKDLIVINLAADGYKQPQQLMAFSYFLSLGAEFDLILNLDGFNEITLPLIENIPKKVFHAFPRRWASRVKVVPEDAYLAMNIFFWKNVRSSLSGIFNEPILRLSGTIQLAGFLIDRQLKIHMTKLRENIWMGASSAPGYAASGPYQQGEDSAEAVYRNLISVWRNSSLAIHRLSSASEIRYFHFLQPNQYVPASKILTREERREAYDRSAIYKTIVEYGYPLLAEAGAELTAKGVSFLDLSNVFAAEAESVYIDNCCHVSKKANEHLGTVIGEAILGRAPVLPPVSTGGAAADSAAESGEYAMGLVSVRSGDLVKAESHFRSALRSSPEDALSRFQLARVFLRMKKDKEAERELREVLRKDPQHAVAHFDLAGILKRNKKNEEALSHYQEAIHHKPGYIPAHYETALLFAGQGKTDEANKHYQAAVQSKPVSAEDYYHLGMIFESQNKLLEAVGNFLKALELRPRFLEAHYQLGIIYAMQRSPEKALEQFQEVLKEDPRHVDAQINVGNIQAEKNNFDLAVLHYTAVLKNNPEHSRAHYNLGLVFKRMNKKKEAVKHFRKALEADPSYLQAQTALENLK